MITVTGATGALNGATVDHLLERHHAAEITVVARDVAKAQRFAQAGVEVRQGDYAEPTSLPRAFEGADKLLLVSSSDPTADAVQLHRNAIDAAVRAGVGHILYTSHQGASPGTPFRPGRDHAATEELLARSGVGWTSLRNGFYSHSLDWLIGPWRKTDTITVPADGPVSWTARSDEAEAAALILSSSEVYDGPVTLTAREAPTFRQLAAVASEVTGRPIGFELVDQDEWVAAQVASGQPEHMAQFILGMYRAASEGYFAGTSPLLGELLGREPIGVAEVLATPVA